MDSGHVHQVSFNNTSSNMNRTFIKIVFSPDLFNRVGNDHNYLFDYNWPLYQRSVERNNSSILDGYVTNDVDFEYVPLDKLCSAFTENYDWLDNNMYNVHRKGHAIAKPAEEGEFLVTNDMDGNFVTCLVAQKNDWKIKNPIT